MKCPKCGIFNPETAERCDCGYLFKTRPTGTASATQSPRNPDSFSEQVPFVQVTVVDVNMSFGSMVFFMVKWAIASIPAFLILVLLGALVTALYVWILTRLGG